MKTITGLVVVVLFVTVLSLYYFYDTKRTDKLVEQLKTEYPSITRQQELHAIVTRIDHGDPKVFRNSPHHAFIVLNDSFKKRINASYELSTDTLSLDDVLSTGDLLIKESNSDRFFIYKSLNGDTLKYSFELNDDLGYPLKK